MNKIFKIVKNGNGKNVVTSELAKGASKGCTAASVLIATLMGLGSTSALATTTTSNNGVIAVQHGAATGKGIALGHGATVIGSEANDPDGAGPAKAGGLSRPSNAVAIGSSVTAQGASSIALGVNAKAIANLYDEPLVDAATAAYLKTLPASTLVTPLAVAIGHNVTTVDALGIGHEVEVTGTHSNAMGYRMNVSGGFASAVGYNVNVAGENAAAFGAHTTADGKQSTALGVGATATKEGAIAAGEGTQATGDSAMTFGRVSQSTAEAALTVGYNSTTSAAHAITVGNNNKNSGADTMVLGNNVTTDVANSVVLGNSSTAAAAVATTEYKIKDTTHKFAGVTPVGTVSVGAAGKERTITNVAAGRISGTSTDAINGSQLYALIGEINKPATGNISFTAGGKTATTNLGETLNIAGDSNINTVIDPDKKTLTISLNKNVTGDSFKAGNVSFSNNGINAGNQKVSNVKDGDISANSKDAVNGSQLHTTNQNVANNAGNITKNAGNIATNAGNIATNTATIAKGFNVSTDDNVKTNVKLGDTLPILGDSKNVETKTDGGKVIVTMKDAIKVSSVTAGNVSLSTTGINAGGNKVTNVKDGDLTATSTDAVNGSQLYATNQAVKANTDRINSLAGNINNFAGDINKLGDRVDNVENKLQKQNRQRKAGTASAMATAGLMQPHKPGQSGLVAAVGQYESQTAVAVGYSRISDNGKIGVKLSLSTNTQGETGGTIGAGYFW
ncbi:hypothetical protein A4G18_03875 [Pasteurellaceae bacterium Pebbles2]|nr:hypothetical protein [Pasteurellaceae bacterium Pebbles2]